MAKPKAPNLNSQEPKQGATRDEHGRFLPGVSGCTNSPGRPPRSVEEQYLKDLRDTVSAEQWIEIVKRAVADARNGDTAARSWLAKYLLPDIQKLQVSTAGTLADWLAELINKP